MSEAELAMFKPEGKNDSAGSKNSSPYGRNSHAKNNTKQKDDEPEEKSLARSWAEITTFHGVLDLFNTPYIAEKVLWAIILLSVVVFSIKECTLIFNSLFRKDTAISITVADEMKKDQIADMLTVYYCILDWPDRKKISTSRSNCDSQNIALYSVSLIPNVGIETLDLIYSSLESPDLCGIHREPKRDNSNFTDYYNFDETSESLWNKLQLRLTAQNKSQIGDFIIANYLDYSMLSDITYNISKLTFQHGKLCIHMQAPSTQYRYSGSIDKQPGRYVFKFYHSAIPESYPQPVRMSLMPYYALDKVDEENPKGEKFIDLEASRCEIDEKDGLLHFYSNFMVVVKKWTTEVSCTDFDTSLHFPPGYAESLCNHKCYDTSLRNVSFNHCSFLSFKWAQFQNQNLASLQPCASSGLIKFRGLGDYTAIQLDDNQTTQELQRQSQAARTVYDSCVEDQRCNSQATCIVWIYDIVQETGMKCLGEEIANVSAAMPFGINFIHDVRIEFAQGVVYTEYLKVKPSSVWGDIGGVFGLFMGASILSFVQAVLFVIKALFCKKTIVEAEAIQDSKESEVEI